MEINSDKEKQEVEKVLIISTDEQLETDKTKRQRHKVTELGACWWGVLELSQLFFALKGR